jgi:Xaa-Pro aminopeptidase
MYLDPNCQILFTDSRYAEQAPVEIARHGVDVKCVIGSDPFNRIAELARKRNVHVDGEKCSWSAKETIESLIEGDVIDAHKFCLELRCIKDKSEIEKIRTAAEITCVALDSALAELNSETTEKELARNIESFMIEHGALNAAYPPIVAAGKNSALPHARPSSQRILDTNLLLVDVGANFEGYCSDMTRMIPLSELSKEQEYAFQIVLDAQIKAIESIRPGMRAKEVDEICRDALSDAITGGEFLHGTGHGVGLEIHEYPRINSKSDDILQEGMVVTVEPGIYIEGSYGVRWEDLLLVTGNGVEYLTNYEKRTQVRDSHG